MEMLVLNSAPDQRTKLARLDGADRMLVRSLFGELSPECLYRRFFRQGITAEQFTAAVLKSDQFEREAVGALENDALVGVAQYSRVQGSRTADLAVLVADRWQRRGIGVRLLISLVERARARGIEKFAVSLQLDNFGALRLLRRIAPRVRLVHVGGGVGEATIPLDTVLTGTASRVTRIGMCRKQNES